MTDSTLRSIELTRIGTHQFEATNVRGGKLVLGEGTDDNFTPTELLLVAIAGCSSLDVDYMTTRRAEPESFDVTSSGHKVSDEGGNRMTNIVVNFRLTFPEGEGGDAARQRLEPAITRSHDRLCIVSRTVQLPTPVTFQRDGQDLA